MTHGKVLGCLPSSWEESLSEGTGAWAVTYSLWLGVEWGATPFPGARSSQTHGEQ